MSFADLGLSDKVLEAVATAGYTDPTPIQAQAIPHVLARRDVLGVAQTGTGKTAAFTLPMLTLLESGRARARMPRTLVLEPTRELAAQVVENFERYGINHRLSVALLIGGVSFGDQDMKITRGVDVLIATPGRLLDHFERGKLLLSGVELLVIDEADRMLDMGFIPDIERIVKMVPFTRQTLFFSATMPPEIERLADAFLHNPVRTEVSRPASTSSTIIQRLIATGQEAADKREALRGLIRSTPDFKNAIIFCNRKREVAVLHRSLLKHGFSVAGLHGDMDQRSRTNALDSFRNGEVALLVASDVAARGLDIPAVSHVFNFDVPHHAEDYVHRIGRTGRAGLSGQAFTLVGPSDGKSLSAIESLIGQPIAWEGPTKVEASTAEAPRRERSERGGERGGRSRARGRDGRPENGEREGSSSRRRSIPRGEPRTEHASPDDSGIPIAPASARASARAPREPGRGRRNSGSPRPEQAPRDQTPRAEPAPRAERARPQGDGDRFPPIGREPREPRESRAPRERRDRDLDDGAPVVGLGDHMPAFLTRPPARPKG